MNASKVGALAEGRTHAAKINRILGKPWEEVLEPLRAIDQREVAPLQAI